MSCCGAKRSEAAAARTPAPVWRTDRPLAVGGAAVVVGTASGPEFEYLGGDVLTVLGQGSGRIYRFVGHGARLRIDARDQRSLATVPRLRELTPRRG